MLNRAYGTHGRQIESADLAFTESLRGPGQVLPAHAHEFTNVAVVMRGKFVETIAGEPQACARHSLIIRPAGEKHADHYGSTGASTVIIEIKPARASSVRKSTDILERARHLTGDWIAPFTARLRQELRVADRTTSLALEALTLELLAAASRRAATTGTAPLPRWLRHARGRSTGDTGGA